MKNVEAQISTTISAFIMSKTKFTKWYANKFNPLTTYKCLRFDAFSLRILPIMFAGTKLKPIANTEIKATVDVYFA